MCMCISQPSRSNTYAQEAEAGDGATLSQKKKTQHKQAGRQNVVSPVEPQSRPTVDGESVRSVLLGSDPLFLLLFFLHSIFFFYILNLVLGIEKQNQLDTPSPTLNEI